MFQYFLFFSCVNRTQRENRGLCTGYLHCNFNIRWSFIHDGVIYNCPAFYILLYSAPSYCIATTTSSQIWVIVNDQSIIGHDFKLASESLMPLVFESMIYFIYDCKYLPYKGIKSDWLLLVLGRYGKVNDTDEWCWG